MEKISVCGVHRKGSSFLLAKRKVGGTQGGRWEFPGGKLEPLENPQEALIREFLEELDMKITVGPFLGETTFVHRNQEYRLLAYSIHTANENFTLLEHDEAGWFSPSQVRSMDLSESDRSIFELLEK